MIFKTKEAEAYHRHTDWGKIFVSKLYPILDVEPVFTEMTVIGNGQSYLKSMLIIDLANL